MKTAVNPAISRTATGTNASSSRFRALMVLGRRRPDAAGRGSAGRRPSRRRRPSAALVRLGRRVGTALGRRRERRDRRRLQVLDQRVGVVARAELVVGEAVTAVLGQRRGLDRHRVDLVVEVEVERQLVGQAAVQRDPAALVDAQEVDLARSVDGGDADPAMTRSAARTFAAVFRRRRRGGREARPAPLGARPRRARARRRAQPPRHSGRSRSRRPPLRRRRPPRAGRRPP